MDGIATQISLCRPGWEAVLAEELGLPAAPAPAGGVGWLAWPARGRAPAPGTLIFERQRLPHAMHAAAPTSGALAEALAAAALPALERAPTPHALHVFAPDPTGERSLSPRAARLQLALERLWAARAGDATGGMDGSRGGSRDGSATRRHPARREPARTATPRAPDSGTVWQVCVVEGGAWWALTPAAALVDPYPGGVHRMARDAAAPSRSALKLEEALERMAAWGLVPRPGERVVDLGAAPGGWSHAMLARGCRVLAVDNGPLKLRGLDALPGTLTHLRVDALRLHPPPGWLPADWLLADLLVPPGVCLGLLRKWIEGGWMRRAIVNVKLPQRQPLAALRPLQDYLAGVPGLRWRLRQLYHDRREVTLLADLRDASPPRARRPPRPADRPADRPAPPRRRRHPQPRRRS